MLGDVTLRATRLEIAGGERIDEAARRMVDVAAKTGRIVIAEFNGLELIATSSSIPAEIESAFGRAHRARQSQRVVVDLIKPDAQAVRSLLLETANNLRKAAQQADIEDRDELLRKADAYSILADKFNHTV